MSRMERLYVPPSHNRQFLVRPKYRVLVDFSEFQQIVGQSVKAFEYPSGTQTSGLWRRSEIGPHRAGFYLVSRKLSHARYVSSGPWTCEWVLTLSTGGGILVVRRKPCRIAAQEMHPQTPETI
jgi:hypothetical protein